jgi:hypothetical protein
MSHNAKYDVIHKQDRQGMYNVNMRCVHATTAAVEKQ